jgi:hypothetical protein
MHSVCGVLFAYWRCYWRLELMFVFLMEIFFVQHGECTKNDQKGETENISKNIHYPLSRSAAKRARSWGYLLEVKTSIENV